MVCFQISRKGRVGPHGELYFRGPCVYETEDEHEIDILRTSMVAQEIKDNPESDTLAANEEE